MSFSFIAQTESGTEYKVVDGVAHRNGEFLGQYIGRADVASILGLVLAEDPAPKVGSSIAVKTPTSTEHQFFVSTDLVSLELI